MTVALRGWVSAGKVCCRACSGRLDWAKSSLLSVLITNPLCVWRRASQVQRQNGKRLSRAVLVASGREQYQGIGLHQSAQIGRTEPASWANAPALAAWIQASGMIGRPIGPVDKVFCQF